MGDVPASPPPEKKTAAPIRLLQSPFVGGVYPLRALRLLRQTPEIRGYILVPIGLNICLGMTLYISSLLYGVQLIDQWLAHLPAWAEILSGVLQALLVIVLLLLTGILLLQFGVLLGSPWYSQLSEKLEIIRTGEGPPTEPFNPLGPIRDLWRAISFELKKLVLLLGVGLPLFLLNFLPGVGTAIATVGSLSLATTIICLDFLDPPLERRRLSFRRKLGLIFRSFPASATFGLTCLGLVGIPFLNLLAIPLCVTAGTLFFCDQIKAQIDE